MLSSYDRAEAAELIMGRVYWEDYPWLSGDEARQCIERCIEADFDYMRTHDILRPDGSAGNCYYNVDNARNHIMMALIKGGLRSTPDFRSLYDLVEDYMDYNRSYLEKKGLHYHVDEQTAPAYPAR